MSFLERLFPNKRATVLPNGSVPISSANFAQVFGGLFGAQSASGVSVTVESALGVPAVWAAVNFISGTLAGLPLQVFRRKGSDREAVTSGVYPILHDAVNDEMSSFEWRKYMFEQVLTTGRGLTYIERSQNGKVLNLWPLNPAQVTIKRVDGLKIYEHKQDGGKSTKYAASEIIDIPYMLKPDGLGSRGPITANKDAIGLAIAATEYGSRFFQNGGVPPFAVTGGFQSGAAMDRAGNDLEEAVRKASKDGRQALILPTGLDIKTLGSGAKDSQLVELQQFCIEQVARIYSIPPTFLQDLTHGTFSNTEQQDLHLSKHLIKRWVEQFEQEINLKLFGRKSSRIFAEFNLDGLLRGDFKARMEGYSSGIQNAILSPNEVRRRENLPADADGNHLMIQGGTVPVKNQILDKTGDGNED